MRFMIQHDTRARHRVTIPSKASTWGPCREVVGGPQRVEVLLSVQLLGA